METRRLGHSDLNVSILGMGCWQYGGGSYWGEQSQSDVDDVVREAVNLGINYFDTAEVYNDGDSERSLGIAMKGLRDRMIIGSKISTGNIRPAQIKRHCEASLNRLQTDYIDLYMLHWPINRLSIKHYTNDELLLNEPPDLSEVLGALSLLKQEGKIRHIGISNHGVEQMKQAESTGIPVAANELAYNLFSRAIEADILPYCVNRDIGIIGYIPLMQGLLSGKYSSFQEMKPLHLRTRHFHQSRGEGARHGEEGAEAELEQALTQIREVADELGVTMGTLSLAWSTANTAVSTTIVGSRNIQQLRSNAEAATLTLSGEVMSRLNEITQPVLSKLGDNPDYYENRYNSRIR
jgi:aryl-alcohol dehydrogenase-like predicted oxidoreductase